MFRPRSWTETDLRKAAKQSRSIRQIIDKIGLRPTGGNYAQMYKYIAEYSIDISHLKGSAWNKGLAGQITVKPQVPLEEALVLGSTFQSYKLKFRLFKAGLKEPLCEQCGWSERSPDGRLPLELHHRNGD